MVLESIINPFDAEQHPWKAFVLGGLFAVVGLFLGLMVFPSHASIVMITFVTIASVPLLYNMIKYEEEKDMQSFTEYVLLAEHGKAIWAYFSLFAGMTLALAALFLILPTSTMLTVFDAQIDTLTAINPHHEITGDAIGAPFFVRIFLNNIRVLGYCIVFSFLFGAGAIFILAWNASVIGLAMGDKIRNMLASLTHEVGLIKVSAYLGIPAQVIFLRYGIHGSLEILAYIIGALAGGIISVAVIRHHYSSRKFEHIVLDAADLLLLSLAVLFIAGAVETWISPVFG